jgi:hypothetical protein
MLKSRSTPSSSLRSLATLQKVHGFTCRWPARRPVQAGTGRNGTAERNGGEIDRSSFPVAAPQQYPDPSPTEAYLSCLIVSARGSGERWAVAQFSTATSPRKTCRAGRRPALGLRRRPLAAVRARSSWITVHLAARLLLLLPGKPVFRMANQSPVPVEFYGLSCSLSLPVRFPTNFPLQIHSQRDQKLKRAYTSQKKNKKKTLPAVTHSSNRILYSASKLSNRILLVKLASPAWTGAPSPS